MGCPIRKSRFQSLLDGSTWLIAAFHVLHRLSVPRHSPYALRSLNNCSPLLENIQHSFNSSTICSYQRSRSLLRLVRRASSLVEGLIPGGGPHPWWRRPGSNRRPADCKPAALPAELRPQNRVHLLVGIRRFELLTSRLSGARSNQLSYIPRIL